MPNGYQECLAVARSKLGPTTQLRTRPLAAGRVQFYTFNPNATRSYTADSWDALRIQLGRLTSTTEAEMAPKSGSEQVNLVNGKKLARLYKVGYTTIINNVRKEGLPSVMKGRHRLFNTFDVAKWAEAHPTLLKPRPGGRHQRTYTDPRRVANGRGVSVKVERSAFARYHRLAAKLAGSSLRLDLALLVSRGLELALNEVEEKLTK